MSKAKGYIEYKYGDESYTCEKRGKTWFLFHTRYKGRLVHMRVIKIGQYPSKKECLKALEKMVGKRGRS